jgi:hypothetical protein
MFRDYANEACLIITTPPDELNRTPDEEGNEHQVWFLPDTETVLKATWPDFFGLLVVHRPHEEHKASPIAYLERWHLHNEVFDPERKIVISDTHRGNIILMDDGLLAPIDLRVQAIATCLGQETSQRL